MNGTPLGGKWRAMYYSDLWTLKYLPKFKWDNLNEKFEYDRKVWDQWIWLELSKAKRESSFF